jgi:hypothetical protein
MLKAQGLDVDSNPRMILVVPEVSWNITVSDQSERTIDVVKGGAVYPYQLGEPFGSLHEVPGLMAWA